MTTRIKLRRDTAANWFDANPILAAGEPGLETDTGKIKYGDGVSHWNVLEHAGGDTLNDEGGVTVTAGSTKYWVAAQRRDDHDTYGRGVRHDSLGNVYSLTQTFDGDDDVTVITKYSPLGAVVWQHSIDQATACALAIDSSDCAYVAMRKVNDVHLIKFTTGGNIDWKKSYDGGNWTGEAFIEERTSNRLVLTANRDNGDLGVLVLDINMTTGDVVTQKIILNGSYNISATGIDTDANGNVFVTGRYYSYDPDKDKMFVEKLNGSLDRVWAKSLETDTTYNMSGGDCASDSQGNVYVVGYYNVNTINPNGNTSETAGVLIKLNSSGVVQWTRRLGPGPCGQSVVGLTATNEGEVYLVTSTLELNLSYTNEWEQIAYGTGRMMLVKYNTAGAVLWQRYVDAKHVWENNDDFRGQTVSVFDDKVAVDFYGQSSNNIPWNFSSTDDNEDDYFLVQLPTDGTELQIGDLAFRESRIPGRFVTHETTTSPTTLEVFENGVTVATSDLALDAESRVANALVKSQVYDYVFGPDGTFTIPNDGDLKLTQSQIGWLGVIGGTVNYNDDKWGRAVTADSQGNMYAVGEDDDYGAPIVVKIGPEGNRIWGVAIREDIDNDNGRANGVAINPVNGNVLVLCEMYGNYTYSTVITIDQDTGRILSNIEYVDNNNDVYLNDVAFLSTGEWIAGGSRNGNFSEEQTVSAGTGSTTSTLIVLRSEVDGIPTNNWQIGGTGFSVFENLQSVEYYAGVTTTVRQGSGATFDIIDNGNGTYSAGIVSSGTNYLAGHKIQISGLAIGGLDVTNDITITVDAVDAGGITGVSNSGTAAGTTSTTYNALTGTNYLVGSGAEFNYWFDPATTGTIYSSGLTNVGQNYVVGDVIVIPGTSFAGGTSPVNDITVTVTSVGGAGDLQNPVNFTGTPALTHLLLSTNNSVDFADEATFAIKQALGGETFIWTPDFSKSMGGSSSDTFYGVVWNAAGTSLYAVGEGRYETTYDQALVTKWSSTGTIQASVSINANNSNNGAEWGTVALMADDHIVTVHNMYNAVRDETTEVLVTKLDSNLQIVWQQFIGVWSQDDGWSSPDGQPSVAVDPATDEILIAWEHEDDDFLGNDDGIYIVKLDTDGDVIWKRGFGVHESDTRTRDSAKFLSISGDKYTIVGTTDAPDNGDNNNAMIFTMPLDGTGLGYHGMWWYFEPNDDQIKVMRVDRESDAFTPNINNNVITATDNVKYYYTNYPDNEFDLFRQVIRSEVGGALEFADGSKQSFSTAIVPQVRISAGRYYIRPEDSGRHILVEDANYNIRIPNYREVTLPVGFTFTIVNISGSTVNVENQYVDGGERGQMWFSGGDTQTPVVGIDDNGSGQMVTLIKIKEGTTSDDGSNHGDIWMIAGADIYNND